MDLLEKLAEHDHKEWIEQTKYMLENMTPENIERWNKEIEIPYKELKNHEKVPSREKALEIIEIFKEDLNSHYR